MKYLTPKQYVMIDVANNFGLDKETWEDRLSWVDNNDKELEELVHKADKKILYAKAVRAYRLVQQGKPTNHPVSLDSTASFLQVISIIMHCEKSAEVCNLIDTGKREDIYSSVMNHMNNSYGLSCTRDDIKYALMPYFYGSVAEPIKIFGKGTMAHTAFLKTIGDLMPGASLFLKLAKMTWNPEATVHEWTRDDGVHVRCPVLVKQKKRINFGKSQFTHIAEVMACKEKGVSNAANMIQSIDALIVSRMLQMAKVQGYELYTIHDAFFSHANYMQQTRENFLSIILDLISKPILVDWLEKMLNRSVANVNSSVINNLKNRVKTGEYFLS